MGRVNAARERLFQRSCDAWVAGDGTELNDFFSNDVSYVESDGSRYEGLAEIHRWFADWLTRGEVLSWQVLRYVHQGNTSVAEWCFRCRYDGVLAVLDGVTLMDFDASGKISRLREFSAKNEAASASEPPAENVDKT